MYATIRHRERGTASTDELARAGHALAARLGTAPGFVAYLLLETPDGGHAAVCIFEDRASLEDADGLVAGSLAAHLAAPGPGPSQLAAGEVIAQKGL
jgi:hypothetical protein